MGSFSRSVTSAVSFFFSLLKFFSFSLFQFWVFDHLNRHNCSKSSVNASSSDHTPSRGWLAESERSAFDVDVDAVQTDVPFD